MSYQFLTLEMIEYASKKVSSIDQRKFKTADRYIFDSFRLDKTSLHVIKGYKFHIRPLLNPSCDFLLVNRNGTQFTKLTEALGKLVFEAIGKYINPTRYRQIIKTASCSYLDSEEQEWISEDQKHSSNVARISYKKKRSREIAIRGRNCVRKLQGEEGEKVEKQLATLFTEDETVTDESEHDDIFITQISPINDDQFNSQNRCRNVKESCGGNCVIQNSHLPYTTSESEKNCLGNEQSFEEIFNKQNTSSDSSISERQNSFYSAMCNSIPSDTADMHSVRLQFQTIHRSSQKQPFTPKEDDELMKGLKKLGWTNWTNILRDKTFTFSKGRTAGALKKRASSKGFKLNTKIIKMRQNKFV